MDVLKQLPLKDVFVLVLFHIPALSIGSGSASRSIYHVYIRYSLHKVCCVRQSVIKFFCIIQCGSCGSSYRGGIYREAVKQKVLWISFLGQIEVSR